MVSVCVLVRLGWGREEGRKWTQHNIYIYPKSHKIRDKFNSNLLQLLTFNVLFIYMVYVMLYLCQ